MKRTGWPEPVALATELLVVFVGLFAALQLDDWRERREQAKTETIYLHRLSEDLHAYVASLERVIPNFENHSRAVRHVSDSLAAGRILDDDTALFEAGLVYVGHLPSIKTPSSAYQEMVASGAFARLRSTELQKAVAELYATQAVVDANFSWWRELPNELQTVIAPYVEYYSAGPRVKSTDLLAEADEFRARYDFDQLRARPEIRNGYYWAADTHSDWVEWSTMLLELARAADAAVMKELAAR
jgi:hypothetical protein